MVSFAPCNDPNMANIHSAIKQIRKDARKRGRNQTAISELKNLGTKLLRTTPQESAQAQTLARELVSKWDRAVSRGLVPRGRADRKKSRIAHLLAKLSK